MVLRIGLVTFVLFICFILSGCGNTAIRGEARDSAVSQACFEAGFAPCNSLVVAVQEHRRGNLTAALTSLNVWLAQIGFQRSHLTTSAGSFEPIARRSPDASRLFADAVRNPGIGETIPMRKTALDSKPAVVVQSRTAPPVAPVSGQSSESQRGWLTKDEFQTARSAGRLRAVGSGFGFLVVSSPVPGAQVFIGGRPYALDRTIENVQSGYREFKVSADGFSDTVGFVPVEPLKVSRIHVPLERGRGALTIISSPSNAEVVIDGVAKGKTPVTLENMAAGMYDVRLSLGVMQWQGRVRVSQGTEVIRPSLSSPRPAPVPVVRQPVQPAPAPIRSVTEPVRAVNPPPTPSNNQAGVDLRSLGPDLELMAWKNLRGKTVFISLSGGNRIQVLVGDVQGDSVILTPADGQGRRVPMRDIVRVEE